MSLHNVIGATARKAHRLRIVKPELLADVTCSLIARFGSQAATSRATGIQQSQLSRLASGRLSEIGLAQFERFAKQLSAEERARVARAFFSREAQLALRTYEAWLARTVLRLGRTDDTRQRLSTRPRKGDKPDLPIRHGERSVKALHKELMTSFPWLYNKLLAEANAHKVGRVRFNLALLRVIEPLLEHAPSGCIERSWRELTRDELRQFVELGIQREIILFARSSDFLRAQAAGRL